MSGTDRRSPAGILQCWQVMRVMQAYVDGETDSVTAERVAEHLEDCRRCGLEADTYQAIKDALARHERPSREAAGKLRAFWHDLLQQPNKPAS